MASQDVSYVLGAFGLVAVFAQVFCGFVRAGRAQWREQERRTCSVIYEFGESGDAKTHVAVPRQEASGSSVRRSS